MIILTYANLSCGPNISITACDSFVSLSGNYTWTASGIYQDTIASTPTCSDTILTMDITINSSYTSTEVVNACGFYIWPMNGNAYTISGIYGDTLSTVSGCDSILLLDLTINDANSSTENISVCESYTWPLNGVTYTSDANANVVLTGANGCDSTVYLVLDILDGDSVSYSFSACGNYFWPSSNQSYTSSGQYSVTFQNQNGCDSVEVLDLTINTIDLTVSQNGDFLNANQANAEYQWLNCDDNYAPIPNDTNQIFSAASDGSYAVIITTPECIDTSDCISIVLSIEDVHFGKGILVSPNPVQEVVNINLGEVYQNITIEVIDVLGQVVQSESSQNRSQFSFAIEQAAGFYYLRISTSIGQSAVVKIVKE
jgi:hypothetical protein